MKLVQKIKKYSLSIGSILFIIMMIFFIANSERLSFQVYMILACGLAIVMITSVAYQAYINLRQFYLRKKCVSDSIYEGTMVEEINDIECNEESNNSMLENRISFIVIGIIASLLGKRAEWNKQTNDIIVHDR